MASPFQQQSLQRKFIYFGLVVALFTGALLFRKLVINSEAEKLRLRSADQGEVALTDTAMRLAMGGLRGLAITSLWLTAIKHQERHEWSELEAAIRSLTKLQPHYISPWLFQSWNLAFNVSVECDRSRDKYFYISRGIELLAEGERRNRGNENPDPELRSPANPEMRYYIGFTYQLKIGQGDEKRTLRSLLDLSCIDPNRRRPEALWAAGQEGKKVDAGKFREFCAEHPRLVRRLREQLGMTQARDVVNFLADNRELPSRFRRPLDTTGSTPLLPPEEQFPVLPPFAAAAGRPWPNPNDAGFGGVEPDVFAFTRTWYEYAQEPLPPPSHKVGVDPKAIPGHSRMPKMDQYAFRTYPARSQAYIAEELEAEGWFDGEGWLLSGRFADLGDDNSDQDVVVGKARLNAREAWKKAHQMYVDYGAANGLYGPARFAQLKEEAERRPNSKAAREFLWMSYPLSITNYHDFLEQARAESSLLTIAARRKFYRADQLYQEQNIRQLAAYREALSDWVDVALAFPAFADQSNVKEDLYEAELKYLRKVQSYGEPQLKPLLEKLAARAVWPPRYVDRLPDLAQLRRFAMKKVIPTRQVSGPLELTFVYKGANADRKKAEAQRERFKALTLGLAQLLPVPLKPRLTAEQDRRLLAAEGWRNRPPGPGWVPLMDNATVQAVRDRLGLNPPAPAQQPATPAGARPAGAPPAPRPMPPG